mmetsp:Transcript_11228/g.24697  ORF Transcript_11228/g.24697 Transcript_11228/m.24697 type:complete len:223 (+) Transcript_11228:444-1112(+)
MATTASSSLLRNSFSSSVCFTRFAIREARESSAGCFFVFLLLSPSFFDPLVSSTLFLNAKSFAMVSPSRLSLSFLFAEEPVPDFKYFARLASTAPMPLDLFDLSSLRFRSPFELLRSICGSCVTTPSAPLLSCLVCTSFGGSFASTVPMFEDNTIFDNDFCLFPEESLFISLPESFSILSFALLRLSTSASILEEGNVLSLGKTSWLLSFDSPLLPLLVMTS